MCSWADSCVEGRMQHSADWADMQAARWGLSFQMQAHCCSSSYSSMVLQAQFMTAYICAASELALLLQVRSYGSISKAPLCHQCGPLWQREPLRACTSLLTAHVLPSSEVKPASSWPTFHYTAASPLAKEFTACLPHPSDGAMHYCAMRLSSWPVRSLSEQHSMTTFCAAIMFSAVLKSICIQVQTGVQ